MHCDTVWLFPHVERLALVWRGVFPLATDDETEVSEVLLGLERLGEPLAVAHYHEVRQRRLDKRLGALHALRDADLLPRGVRVTKPSAGRLDELLPDGMGELGANLRRRAELELARAREQLRQAGLDPDAALPSELPATAELETDDLGKLFDQIDEQVAAATKQADAHQAKAMDELRQRCQQAGLDPEEVVARERRNALGPPRWRAQQQLDALRGLGELSAATGVPLPEALRVQLEDPALEDKLRLVERQMREAYRRSVHAAEAVPPLPDGEGRALRSEVESALDRGESLAGRDLTGADLAGLDFSGRDLSDVLLESARLDGCNFDGALLERAVLAHAQAPAASFRAAKLNDANLGCADLARACFAEAKLDHAILHRTKLDGATLEGAELNGADLTEATLDGAVLRGCRAEGLTLAKSSLAGADLSEIDCRRCNFLELDCRDASFAGARLDQSVFLDVNGDGASFRDASLRNLRVVRVERGSSFARADFRDADLETANLRGANLAGSDFRGARAHAADFAESDLSDARLDGIRAVEARFERAKLDRASFAAADLMLADLRRSSVCGTSFEHANLFRADGMRMVGDRKTSLRGANIQQFHFAPERNRQRGPDGAQ
jgi:uncharacterized protein YjbI with pentapeptide repeats